MKPYARRVNPPTPLRRAVRRLLKSLAVVLLALGSAGLVAGCCVFSGPRYTGPKSDHFDGEHFVNQTGPRHSGFGDLMKWATTRQKGPWREWTDAQPGPPPPRRVGPGELRVTFVNHATTLVQLDGLNVLTDPIWSERCSPVSFAGPKRHRPPGLRFEDLPPIDAVVLSHNHYDHLDLPTLRQLQDAWHPRFFVGLGNRALLEKAGLDRVTELDWWQEAKLSPEVTVSSVPAEHFSNRGMCDRDSTLWTGYVMKGRGGPVYFAGDTGYGPHFRQIRERFGPVRLALLPIGAYKPEWFMAPVHTSPLEVVRAHQELQASTSAAIHFGTFSLGDDGQDDAPQALTAALEQAGPAAAGRFWILGFGEGRDVPPLPGSNPDSPNPTQP